MQEDKSVLTIKIDNNNPVDLAALSASFTAFAEEFKDFTERETNSPAPDNMRLYVKELRSGSIIADLVTFADQADWVIKHIDVLAAFVGNINDIANYFLGKPTNLKEKPTTRQAKNIAKIVEPVANDHSSQMNITVTDGGTVNIIHNYNTIEANAIQNSVNKFLGPQLPASQMLFDQLLALEQVKNDAAKTGDKGVIETVSNKPIKLQFMSGEAKQAILGIEDNPFHCLFLVDVEVLSHGGKPKVYKIHSVKDVIRD